MAMQNWCHSFFRSKNNKILEYLRQTDYIVYQITNRLCSMSGTGTSDHEFYGVESFTIYYDYFLSVWKCFFVFLPDAHGHALMQIAEFSILKWFWFFLFRSNSHCLCECVIAVSHITEYIKIWLICIFLGNSLVHFEK